MFPARDGAIVADLSHNALLAISGDDATAFLHGQFTNDVEALEAGGAQWNGWCSAKGRLLATFLLVKRADGYLLMLPAEIAPAFMKRLGMFVLRSKVNIVDASADWTRLGVAGEKANAAITAAFGAAPQPMHMQQRDGVLCVALDARRFVVLSQATDVREKLGAHATPATADEWEWAGIQAGIPMIVAATQEAFVPQMANFDLVGGVSFRKGCYPGQEIVARTQYRGGLKRRMALGHVDSTSAPRPGDSVYSPAFEQQAAGTVVQAARAPEGGFDLLVVAQMESLASRDLRLGSPDGPAIELRDVPTLPAAQ